MELLTSLSELFNTIDTIPYINIHLNMSVNKYTLFAKKLQGLLSIGTLSGGLLNSYKHQSISNQCILYNLYRNLGPTAAWIYFADHQLIVFTNHAIANSPPFNTKGFN